MAKGDIVRLLNPLTRGGVTVGDVGVVTGVVHKSSHYWQGGMYWVDFDTTPDDAYVVRGIDIEKVGEIASV